MQYRSLPPQFESEFSTEMASRGSGAATSGANGDSRSERYRSKSIEKRTRGLCKKAYELAALCDIDVALICNLPGIDTPIAWPPDRHNIERVNRRYLDTPSSRKLSKNQITLHIPNPAAENTKDTGETIAVADADRLHIPFPSDEDKLRAIMRSLDSKIGDVRRMIAARRMEQRSDPGQSARDRGKKAALGPAPAAASGGDGDPCTAYRDGGEMVARDYRPVWGWGRPDFSAPVAAAAAVAAVRAGGGGPDFSHPCPCFYCPHHGHWFAGFGGRDVSRHGSDGK